MKAGSVKSLCRYWLAGHCEQGQNCVFLHGQGEALSSDVSAVRAQNLMHTQFPNTALQDPAFLMNSRAAKAAIAQQQAAFMQQATAGLVQPGLMNVPMIAQQVPGVQQRLVMKQGGVGLFQPTQQGLLPAVAALGGVSALQSQRYTPEEIDLMSADANVAGFRRKRKSRFHDSNEVVPTVPMQPLHAANPVAPGMGLLGASPAVAMVNVGSLGQQQNVFPPPPFGQVGINQNQALQLMHVRQNTALSPGGGISVYDPMDKLDGGQNNPVSPSGLVARGQMSGMQAEETYLDQEDINMNPQRKKSRFQDIDEASQYQVDVPPEEDNFIENFVDIILSGAQSKTIQYEDNKYEKGISLRGKQTSNMDERLLQSFIDESNRSVESIQERTWDPSRRRGKGCQDGDIFDYQHGIRDSISDRTEDFASNTRGRREALARYGHTDELAAWRNASRNVSGHERPDRTGISNRSQERANSSGYDVDNYRQWRGIDERHQPNMGQQKALLEKLNTIEREQIRHKESYSEYGSRLLQDTNTQTSTKVDNRPTITFPKDDQSGALLSNMKSAKSDSELGVTSPREIIYGDDMPSFIVRFMKNAGMYKSGVQRVSKTYKLPANCIGLTPPKMNAEAWGILTKMAQTRDEMLQDIQRWFATGIIPLLKQVDFFGKDSRIMQYVCRYTSDSLNVMAYVCANLSIKRRLLLRNALHKKYAVLCRRQQPVSEFLFGDNLPNDLLAVKSGKFRIPEAEKNSLEPNNDDPEAEKFKPTFFANLALTEGEVDESVANIINMACSSDGDVSDLREKYKIPKNCREITPPKINPEMWSLISRTGLELDYRLQDIHLSIGEAMVPLMLMLQSVQEKRFQLSETLTLLTDALLLLGNSSYQLNKVRMNAMRRSLPEQVHGYCGFYWPGADHISLEKLKQAFFQPPMINESAF